MYSKKAVWIVIALLLAEAVAVVAAPGRVPRPARVVTAAINLMAAVALGLLLRQRNER